MGRKSRAKKERKVLASQMLAAETYRKRFLCGHRNGVTGQDCLVPAKWEVLTMGNTPVPGQPGKRLAESSMVRACDSHLTQLRRLGMVQKVTAITGQGENISSVVQNPGTPVSIGVSAPESTHDLPGPTEPLA